MSYTPSETKKRCIPVGMCMYCGASQRLPGKGYCKCCENLNVQGEPSRFYKICFLCDRYHFQVKSLESEPTGSRNDNTFSAQTHYLSRGYEFLRGDGTFGAQTHKPSREYKFRHDGNKFRAQTQKQAYNFRNKHKRDHR